MKNRQITLTSRPQGLPTNDSFRLEEIDIPKMQEGQVLLKSKYISVDPYMRGRMNDSKSYIPPFQIGQAIDGGVVAEVIESKNSAFKSGQYVLGHLPWQEYILADAAALQLIAPEIPNPSLALGALGMPGMTAYFGLMDIGKPKAGETLVVSGAAGAVGSLVGQIGKIQGCQVIGIVGSDEKADYLTKELGFDAAINYKSTSNIAAAIQELAPNGVDIYYDNVGGAISDAVISQINFHARIPLCGQISMYNDTEVPMGPRLQPMLLTRSVLMQGFIVSQYQDRYPEGIQQMMQWIIGGKIQVKESIIEGFENTPQAFLGLFEGKNTGKQIVKL